MGKALKRITKAISGGWTGVRDTLETAATLGGNYFLPGSSILTSNLVSKGSQKQLNSPLGKIANIGSGLAGAGVGSSYTGIPAASDVGGGWANAANKVGSAFGNPTLGTDASNSFDSLFSGGNEPSRFAVTNASADSSLPWSAAKSAGNSFGDIAKAGIGLVAGNSLADALGSSTIKSNNVAGELAFKPTQQGKMGLPGSLGDIGDLNPLQQATSLASRGSFGGGLGNDENNYFLNLENRKLVDEGGRTSDISTLTPIEMSYLQKLGLGGYNNSTDLLKAISQWKAA